MNATIHASTRRPSILWSLAFRPFFIAAGLWAALAILLWVWLYATGNAIPSRFDPMQWHIHAMLFGFVYPAIAGFLLTAIPNWTGRRPIHGTTLQLLAAIWLAGRVASMVSAVMPLWAAIAIEMAFPALLCFLATREVVLARNWRNLKVPVPILVLGVADLLMYLEAGGFDIPAGLGWRLAIAATIALISLIGGRIIPAFTRNWLMRQRVTSLPPTHNHVDTAAIVSLQLGLVAWAFLPEAKPVGALLLLAGVLNLWRLVRWQGLSTLSEPLLTVLHIGYLWIGIGALMLGASLFVSGMPMPAAVHAFTAGAIGTMIVAVMPRVTLGHTGRALQADRGVVAIFALVVLATLVRIAAAFIPAAYMPLLVLSGLCWALGFGLFVVKYAPILAGPRPD